MDEAEPIRYAVVGAGHIAQVAVLPAFAHAKENSRLVALISGDAEKREVLRDRYRLELVGGYDEYESVLERAQIDAVYVATPNSLHKEYTLRAAKRGVHVLCEKPLAPSVSDCEEMVEACRRHGVKLMVAYRLHFEEGNLAAIELSRSGVLGTPRLFSSFFSHVVRDGDIRREPSLGGGAAYDLGVYCVNAARHLFDSDPISVFSAAVERDGTDDTSVTVLRFPGDKLAQFIISNGAADVSTYRIAGDKGDLRVEPAYEYAGSITHHLTIGEESREREFPKRDQFAPELVYFSRCILNDDEPEPSGGEGIRDVRVLEAMKESMECGTPVQLPPMPRRETGPTLAQEVHKPPIDEPETIKAPGSSVR